MAWDDLTWEIPGESYELTSNCAITCREVFSTALLGRGISTVPIRRRASSGRDFSGIDAAPADPLARLAAPFKRSSTWRPISSSGTQ